MCLCFLCYCDFGSDKGDKEIDGGWQAVETAEGQWPVKETTWCKNWVAVVEGREKIICCETGVAGWGWGFRLDFTFNFFTLDFVKGNYVYMVFYFFNLNYYFLSIILVFFFPYCNS